jgi:ATP-dependent Clp protease ATP-binding subunit ClpA
MFERITDRARKAMALANQRALQLNNSEIDTEHILLGLIDEGSGLGAEILARHADLREVREAVEKQVRRGLEPVGMGKLPQTLAAKRVILHAVEEAHALGHDEIGTEHFLLALVRERGSLAGDALASFGLRLEQLRDEVSSAKPGGPPLPSMFKRFTDRARTVMALANREAQRFNHEYIGPEHILLGLLKEGGGVGAQVLTGLGLDLTKARLEVEKLVKSRPELIATGKLPQTPRAKRVIEYAIEEAHNLNHNYVSTEHLLLGLLREPDGVAAQVLANMGLQLQQFRARVVELLSNIAEAEPSSQAPVQPPARRTVEEFSRTDPLGQLLSKAILELAARKDKAAWHGQHEIAGQMHEMAEAIRGMLQRLADIADAARGDQTPGQPN